MRSFNYADLKYLYGSSPDLSLEYQAYQAIHMVDLSRWSLGASKATLVLDLPGPMYVFLVPFQPRTIEEREVFVICGFLPYMHVNLAGNQALEKDARERLMLYLGHLLLYCACKPKYKLPFRLIRSDGLARYEEGYATKREIASNVKVVLKSLGYPTIADFMPIFKDHELIDDDFDFLSGRHYNAKFTDPVEIEVLINFPDKVASETIPVISKKSKI